MKKGINVVLLVISSLLCITIIILSLTINNMVRKKYSSSSIADSTVVRNKDVEIFKTESSNYISYIVEDYERNLTYSWQFNKEDENNNPVKENLLLDINLRLSIDKTGDDAGKINKTVNQKKLIVTFDHHGKLPTKAKIRINVSKKFKDNESLYLYYYNPDSKNIEFVEKNLKVKDGCVEFEIDHCSDYFLTAAVVNEAINNPKNVNYIIIGLGAVVLLLILINMIQQKK